MKKTYYEINFVYLKELNITKLNEKIEHLCVQLSRVRVDQLNFYELLYQKSKKE